MKKIIFTLSVLAVLTAVSANLFSQEYSTAPAVRFAPLDIYIDSGDNPLAAYQLELKAVKGDIKIVGVEGGPGDAFSEPPYYDSAALANDRIIIAAFNTGEDLPTEKTRIATIHLQITGSIEPVYETELIIAADADGDEIQADITFETGE